MSGVVLQEGVPVWRGAFGRADVEASVSARVDTPYLVGGLSQMFGATLLLRKCIDQGAGDLNDPVAAWVPGFPELDTRLAQLLAHVSPTGAYAYDLTRFAALTGAIEACADAPYRQLLDEEIFRRFSMNDSAPGTALATPSLEDRVLFDDIRLAQHAATVLRMAAGYAIDHGRAVRTALPPAPVDAARGVVASAQDIAMFDAALRPPPNDFLISDRTRQIAWTRPAPHLPTGLGWFVQNYQGHDVVWQFGMVPDAYSSLIVKVPDRNLTFVLLANSDGLSAPFALENGDVTASVFARLFLQLYLP